MASLQGEVVGSPLMEKATDRAEEIAQFLERMKIKQEQNGVCDETTTSENGRHQCPILWYVGRVSLPPPPTRVCTILECVVVLCALRSHLFIFYYI